MLVVDAQSRCDSEKADVAGSPVANDLYFRKYIRF